ncbi:hypothetical protein ACH5RR_006087 [Cinchona calisaya]|uniref:Uncharacterized protein n=1 Tax=Cinchona calisaya TaxID=153742 RepID=A0ABD3ANA9_9GENT
MTLIIWSYLQLLPSTRESRHSKAITRQAPDLTGKLCWQKYTLCGSSKYGAQTYEHTSYLPHFAGQKKQGIICSVINFQATNNGVAIDQGIAYLLMLVALAITYIIH